MDMDSKYSAPCLFSIDIQLMFAQQKTLIVSARVNVWTSDSYVFISTVYCFLLQSSSPFSEHNFSFLFLLLFYEWKIKCIIFIAQIKAFIKWRFFDNFKIKAWIELLFM